MTDEVSVMLVRMQGWSRPTELRRYGVTSHMTQSRSPRRRSSQPVTLHSTVHTIVRTVYRPKRILITVHKNVVHITQHRTFLMIFYLATHTVIIAQMSSVGREGSQRWKYALSRFVYRYIACDI